MTAAESQRAARYQRLQTQLAQLFTDQPDPIARMATTVAILHHKQPHFFWTGFYRLIEGKLVVGPYQGPLACAVLPGPDGVCWAAVHRNESVLVPDVHDFPGHIACDSRSGSEVVVPVRDLGGEIVAVLDVDSDKADAFTTTDVTALAAITSLIHQGLQR